MDGIWLVKAMLERSCPGKKVNHYEKERLEISY
jgi:hypothetical protein